MRSERAAGSRYGPILLNRAGQLISTYERRASGRHGLAQRSAATDCQVNGNTLISRVVYCLKCPPRQVDEGPATRRSASATLQAYFRPFLNESGMVSGFIPANNLGKVAGG